ncbi:transient receptor potential cation channel subfamily M member 2 isoform X2 [Callorhinchus milii]|uniref:transient receptor potential cation channel subfamily M member 2 isoform X2 n=1 Tax=Callorhinchus milii TaxID=7868 RepID=UPI001C3F7929|nr:transient receptor potential cation channel subfamily M member 2 isoform X2 [Callorhinchus milii]
MSTQEFNLVHRVQVGSRRTMLTLDTVKSLKRNPSFRSRLLNSTNLILSQQDGFKKWIYENLMKMECVCYVENPEASVAGKLVCSCGYLKDHHSGEAISHGYRQEGNKWIYERHVRQVPTDAFGDIVFEGQRNGKYVRVSSGTAPATLYELMTKQWGLNPPHLLISVTGGAKNFYLKPSLRNLFCRGLIKVAKSTGAWIITGGSHAGVMKHVGEAVRRYTMTSSSKEGEVVAIGVATWGIVHNRECLINKEGMFPVEYTLDEENQGRLSCLDHNHSHFILVDDGTHGKYGVEILLRSNLEKYISKQRMGTEDVGIETPIICVVLEGGEGTLNTIHSAMMNGMPCVIVEGSGRAADVLASVANLPVSQITISLMQKQLRTFFSETFNTFSDRRIISWTKKVQDIVRMHQLLTVFKAEKARNQELDVAILQALLKASSNASHLGKENLEHQLKLAVAWDRVDIAKSEIFTDKKRWKILPISHPELKHSDSQESEICDDVEQEFEEPARDLFLWAILQKRKMLANILWVQSSDSIASALVATKILKKLSSEANDTDLSEAMEELAQEYEDRAIGVFTECYRKDPKRAQKLLIRVSNAWGNTTCLRLAIEGDDQNFMAQGGVQSFLTKIWWGDISVDTQTWQVLLCMVLWPIIHSNFISFRQDEEIRMKKASKVDSSSDISQSPSLSEDLQSTKQKPKSISRTILMPTVKEEDLKPLSCCERLRAFYTAPVVVFYWNVLAYFGFLWLFSYVLLIDFQSQPSGREYFLYLWLFTLVCEEIRQLFSNPDDLGFWKKAILYFSDIWNKLDVAAILVFLVGLACRWISETFYYGRIILCLDFIIYCFRVMHIFAVNKTLGPKIIMVKRMMKDIFFFLFLLALSIVAFGVAKQGILIHNEDRLDWIFQGVVYHPYRMIFGEIPIDVGFSGFDLNQCTLTGSDPYKPKCPEHDSNNNPIFPEWITVILLCIYLLFTNILLLNLLIAMFNYTFQLVQENTDKIWKFQRCHLIEEYHSRPSAPPPFIILSHIILFVQCIIIRRPPQIRKKLKKRLEEEEDFALLLWEGIMKENYLAKSIHKMGQSTEQQIRSTADKIDTVTEILDMTKEGSKAGPVDQRMSHLEEQMIQTTRALNWIMNALIEKKFGSKDSAPMLNIPESKSKEQEDSDDEDKDSKTLHHVDARSFFYPDSNIERFPVPDEKVPWEVEFSEYNPPNYTCENVDGDRPSGSSEPKSAPNYNSMDKGIDRSSFCGEYVIEGGFPQNPLGRTGLRGRGKLRLFGPNHMMDPIITRWKRRSEASVKVKGSKNRLEFLIVQYPCEEWGLPGGFLEPGEATPKRLRLILSLKMLGKIQTLMKESIEVKRGYVDDPSNTDNAWKENLAVNLHLCGDNASFLSYLAKDRISTRSESGESSSRMLSYFVQGKAQHVLVKWQVVDRSVPVCVVYKELLQKVAEIQGALF